MELMYFEGGRVGTWMEETSPWRSNGFGVRHGNGESK
jgi:hypothetical protein